MATVKFQLRRDTAANWASVNPTLGPGEPAIEIDTFKVKYGNGVNAWNDLPYAAIDLPAILEAYASGAEPSDFTLSIVDAEDAAAWRAALELGDVATEDYEEGTWTPTVSPGSGAITSYTASGHYTKIGRQVHCTVTINITNNGTGNGFLAVSLPFTSAAGPSWAGVGREAAATGSMLQAVIGSAATSMAVVNSSNGYPGGTGFQIIVSISYFV